MPTHNIIFTTLETIETKFAFTPQCITIEDYNISPGQLAQVIANEKPYDIQLFKFGLTHFRSKSEISLLNTLDEGDSNAEDNPAFRGVTGIMLKKPSANPSAHSAVL